MYIFSGIGDYGALKDLWSFSLVNQIWELEQNPKGFNPIQYFVYTSFQYDSLDYFCIYGGESLTGYSNELYLYVLFRLNITNLEWTMLTEIKVEETISKSIMQYYNDSIYLTNIVGNYANIVKYSMDSGILTTVASTELISNSFLFWIGFDRYIYICLDDKILYRIDLNSLDTTLQEICLNKYPTTQTAICSFGNGFSYFGGFWRVNLNQLVTFQINQTGYYNWWYIDNYTSAKARLSHSLSQINSFLYLFGGKENYIYYNDLWAFDTNKWLWQFTKIAGTSPSPRSSHAAASSGDALLIWGGEGSSGLLNDMFIYNSLTNNWKEIIAISEPTPSERKGACLAFNMPLAYLFGGETSFGGSDELWQYDFRVNEYDLISNYETALAYTNCQLVGNTLLIFCGYIIKGLINNNIASFNLLNKNWTTAAIESPCAIGEISLQLGENYINYGGRDYVTGSSSKLTIENSTYYMWEYEDYSPFNVAFVYYKSNLFFHGGGITTPLGDINLNLALEIFGYIDIAKFFKSHRLPLLCSPGSYLNNSECIICSAGSYAEGIGNKYCKLCEPGKFNSKMGATSKKQCYPCPKGYYNTKYGASGCLSCPSSYACLIGAHSLEQNSFTSPIASIQPAMYAPFSYNTQISNFQLFSGISVLFAILIILFIGILRNRIELLDLFTFNHNYELNIPITLSRNKIGGFFSLVFLVLSLILVGTSLLIYALENIAELKILQPLPVLQQTAGLFYSDINVTATFAFYGDVCEANNECSPDITVIPSDFYVLNGTYDCQNIDGSCVVALICAHCVLGSEASVKFTLDSTYSYSPFIGINVSATSSIPESISSIYSSLTAPDNMIFIGSTNSYFYFMLTPSFFSSEISQFPANSTGYHVSEQRFPVSGSIHSVEDLPTVTNLGVTVFLTESSSGLYTERYLIQSFLILISSILGSVVGLMGAIRFIMRQIENNYLIYTRSVKKKISLKKLKLQRKSYCIIDWNANDRSKPDTTQDVTERDIQNTKL